MGSTPGATATSLTGCGSSVLPKSSMRAAPASWKSGISQMVSRKFTSFLPLQQIDFIRLHSFLIAEQGDEDAKADGGFGHCVGNHKNCEHLSGGMLPHVGEGDQVDIDGVEDEFDGHQNDHH